MKKKNEMTLIFKAVVDQDQTFRIGSEKYMNYRKRFENLIEAFVELENFGYEISILLNGKEQNIERLKLWALKEY